MSFIEPIRPIHGPDAAGENESVLHVHDEAQHDPFTIRPYQLEMFEQSMKRNIIVAAETGSGKTLMYIILL